MPNQGFTSSLVVEVEGTALLPEIAVALTYAYVDDSRVLPDTFVLRFRDPGRNVLEKTGIKIGAKVRLKAQVSDNPSPELLLAGEVTALSVDVDTAGTTTEVRGYDDSHRLFRGRRVAAYANMSVSDIVRKVAQRAGLPVDTVDNFGAPPADSEITQDNISDWDFLQRLADITGAELAVVEGKLSFQLPAESSAAPGAGARARQDPMVLEAGQNVTTIRAAVSSAEQVGQVEVRGWDYLAKQAVTASAPAKTSSAALAGITPQDLAKKFGNGTFFATDVPHRTQAAAKSAAEALAAQIAGAFAEIEGVAKGNPKLRAGSSVSLSGVGTPFEGKYTLSATRHLFSEDAGYTTLFSVSGRQERSLYGLAHGGHERGGRRAVSGLAPAVVSDVRDPRKIGRVKVKFPWLAEDYASGWARTVQLGAGTKRGAMVLPEVGDEVLVGFEQGDFDCPYVLGGLYNGKDEPATSPYELVDGNSGQVAARRLVSRTGHRLELVETASADNVVRLVTGDDKYLLELDKKGTKVTVKSDGTVLIEGNRGITVDAKSGPLELKGNNVSIKGTSGVKVEGATVSISGQGSAELTASGNVTVRGALVKIN
ncbi:MAG TPA: VgrG-related protein [Pseudonocardiaceae bacterium]|nr:VgrG-related protein [Pseudonocardiaceae bacterium]